MTRVAAFVALVVAAVVVAVVLLRSGETHTYHVIFQNAGQLVKDDDVQIGGRRIGSVKDISLTAHNQADVEIQVSDGYAPLHEGTQATIRQTSLSGVANRYITLTPPPTGAKPMPDGATIPASDTTTPVDLDQLLNSLNPPTRKGLREIIRGTATQYAGQGKAANQAAKYFNPALSTTRQVVNQLTSDQEALSAFLRNGGRVTTALAQRGSDITDLVTNASRTAEAISSDRQALSDSLARLPLTLRRANSTFVNLRATLDDLTVLVDASKPATKRLAPFFRELRPLVQEAQPTIADLRALIRTAGPGNDFIDLLNQAPTLERVAQPAFQHGITALRKGTPDLAFIRPYAPELVGALRDFGQGAANYDANGHYARVMPLFTPFEFADTASGGLLVPRDTSQAPGGSTSGNVKRCPGAASQAPADGSAPWRDSGGQLDCNPALVPPGP